MKTKLTKLLTASFFLFAANAFAEDLPEFTKNGDGTLTHNPTGLIVKVCAEGQEWDSSFTMCVGTAKTYTATDALKLTSDFAGQKDWRLPTIEELKAIHSGIKYVKSKHSDFVSSFFPYSPTGFFWSNSLGVEYLNGAICRQGFLNTLHAGCTYKTKLVDSYLYGKLSTYYTYTGSFFRYSDPNSSAEPVFYEKKTLIPYVNSFETAELGPATVDSEGNSYIRLIRGTQWFGDLHVTPKDTPLTDFINNGDGSVTHKKTGLTWQRCLVGSTWNDSNCSGTETPLTHEKAMAVTSDMGGHSDWRVPTEKELALFYQYYNSYAFPQPLTGKHWTSKSYDGMDKSNAFYMDFNQKGYLMYTPKTTELPVRLVRGTVNPESADLVSTIAVGSTSVSVNTDTTITGTVINNGTLAAPDTKLMFYILKNKMTVTNKPADCEDKGTSVVCALGQLDAGKSANRAITVKMTAAGGMSLGISARSNENDANLADNTARAVVTIRK